MIMIFVIKPCQPRIDWSILWDVCFIFMVTVSIKPLLQFNLSTVRLIKIFYGVQKALKLADDMTTVTAIYSRNATLTLFLWSLFILPLCAHLNSVLQMLACVSICYLKTWTLKCTKLQFFLLFCVAMKLDLSHWWKNIDWGC